MEELWSLWRKQNKNIPKVILAFGKEQFPPWSWKLKRLETSSVGSQTSETKAEIQGPWRAWQVPRALKVYTLKEKLHWK